MVDAELQPIDRWMGYTKPMFGGMMSGAMADLATIDEKRMRFEKKATASDADKLARYDASRGEYVAAVALYRKASELDPATDRSGDVFETVFRGYRKEAFTRDELVQAADAAIQSPDPSTTIQTAQLMTNFAMREHDTTMMAKYLAPAVERTKDATEEGVVKERQGLLPAHALYVEKNAEKAIQLRRAALPEGWMENPEELNGYAWWCFEHKVDMPEALKLARKGVELAPPGSERASILDTAAELCNELDDCAEAVELIKRAIADDPENEYYQKQLERFEAILAEKG
jgi:tetratricopeptide (TPR) repeat protein